MAEIKAAIGSRETEMPLSSDKRKPTPRSKVTGRKIKNVAEKPCQTYQDVLEQYEEISKNPKLKKTIGRNTLKNYTDTARAYKACGTAGAFEEKYGLQGKYTLRALYDRLAKEWKLQKAASGNVVAGEKEDEEDGYVTDDPVRRNYCDDSDSDAADLYDAMADGDEAMSLDG